VLTPSKRHKKITQVQSTT